MRLVQISQPFIGSQEAYALDTSPRIPRYILNTTSGPLGPALVPQTLDTPTTVIYGFTNKSNYDLFLKNSGSHAELLPYPLINRYMQGQIDADVDACKLVAIDCESPTQPQIGAVTMQSIIGALERKNESIEISHTLKFNAVTEQYQVDAGAPCSQSASHESSVP